MDLKYTLMNHFHFYTTSEICSIPRRLSSRNLIISLPFVLLLMFPDFAALYLSVNFLELATMFFKVWDYGGFSHA